MKRSVIESTYKNKSLIGIRTNMIEWDETIIGFISDLGESYLTIDEIDEYGLGIGSTHIALDDVISIEIDDRYQKRLLHLQKNSSKLEVKRRTTIWKEGEELILHFQELIKSKCIITFYFDEDNYIIGLLTKYDDTYIEVKNIGDEGDEDGVSYHPINKLIGVRYNSIQEQKIGVLHDNRANFY